MVAPPRERSDEPERLRAFFAIPLDGPARAAAGALVRVLRSRDGGARTRWVPEENLHVTLRFLGDVAASALPALLREVGAQTAEMQPFELRLGRLHPFPSARRPRVIALDLLPPEPVHALAAAVERGVVAAGAAPEERRFRAHLTLGRVRPREPAPDLTDPGGMLLTPTRVTGPDTGGAEDVRVGEGTAFHVTETVLFRSELRPRGSRYTPLGRVPLGAARQTSPPNTEGNESKWET